RRRHWKEQARRRLHLVVALDGRVEGRPERTGRGRDAGVADLGIEAIHVQIDVVIERHLDRLVDAEAQEGRRGWLCLSLRDARAEHGDECWGADDCYENSVTHV